MKKTIFTFLVIVFLCGCLCSCGQNVNSQAADYNSRLASTKEYSFQLEYLDSELQNIPVYVNCYVKDGSYAYRYSKDSYDNPTLSYRCLYTDGDKYEFCEAQLPGPLGTVWGGEYKLTEGVPATGDDNFLYKYTQLILTGSYLTMLQKGEKDSVDGIACTRYAFTLKGMDLTYYFSDTDNNLIKFVYAENGETKTLIYRNYKFSDINADCFSVPLEGAIDLYHKTDKLVYEYVIN